MVFFARDSLRSVNLITFHTILIQTGEGGISLNIQRTDTILNIVVGTIVIGIYKIFAGIF